MSILIVAATPLEIGPFLDRLKNESIAGKPVDILISGIGLTATTYSLLKQIAIRKPRLVIQAGVGGCFDKKISLGEVVIVKKEAIADQSVVELKKLKTLFDLNLLPENKFPFSKGWLVNDHPVPAGIKLKKVGGISVNQITTSPAIIKFQREKFNPVIASLVGAALTCVCLMEKIPFLQLRAVSNYIGERNKKKWKMKDAIMKLNKALLSIIIN